MQVANKIEAQQIALAAGRALGLVPEKEFTGRGSAAASNMRAELKKHGIKARVKQDSYSCIRVHVENADAAREARDVVMPYKSGRFDGMTDCYEYATTAWGDVFGNVEYVFVMVNSTILAAS